MGLATRIHRSLGLLCAAIAAVCTAPGFAQDGPYSPVQDHVQSGDSARIRVLSSRNALVTGDDALVEIDRLASPQEVTIRVNGKDATAAFHVGAAAGSLRALVNGLRTGDNVVEVRMPQGRRARLTLTNSPLQGPLIMGRQEQPFVCMTDAFKLPVTGGTLGRAANAKCEVPARTDYVYRTRDDVFKPLAGPNERPADLAEITTVAGARLPFILRIDTGVINRGIYQTAMLVAPGAWNGALIYQFGGGCPAGMYVQGSATGGVLEPEMLKRGYAVASSTLNVFGNNCDDLLATETMMMVKESFIKRFDVPTYTIGWGCSGGSYQAEQIADNYPGLLDGIVVGCSFPDVGFAAVSVHSFGAKLMLRYYKEKKTVPWTPEQIVAASGLPDLRQLEAQGDRGDRIDPDEPCNAAIPKGLLYNSRTNRRGARCSIYDHGVVGFGRDPKTGFARRPLDNVGVQYGLAALNARIISKAQFVDLNRSIGGIDIDARYTAARTVGDLIALRRAYQTGRFLSGGGGLSSIPIIDVRSYADYSNGDPHHAFHSFSFRERLRQANGRADNMVMLRESYQAGPGLFSLQSPNVRRALDQMGQWLLAIGSDASVRAAIEKVVAAKPTELVDACFADDGTKIVEPAIYGANTRCNQMYRPHGNPYLAAGAPLANNIVKCTLKPIDVRDYSVLFSEPEMAELRSIFRDGVCDYTKAGVEQQPLVGTWLRFFPPSRSR